jgi:transmembrane sensor
LKDDINDIVKELIATSLAGEATAEQQKKLGEWINASADNARKFEAYKKVFALSEKHYARRNEQRLNIDIDQEWNHFTNRIIASGLDKPVRKLEAERSNIWLKVAASLLIVLAAGIGLYYFTSKNDITEFQTANNTQLITLPDGSSISLNQHSSIRYDENFGELNRTVSMTGEGFFDITPNTQKPFIINLKNASIEVVGTSFNVLAYDSLQETSVVVKTGIVRFSVPALKEEVKLTAGEKGVYTSDLHQLISLKNEDPNFIAWKTKELVFNEDELKTVIETLNKTYHAHIVIGAGVPDSCVVTVKFNQQTLEAIMRVLETTLNLTYSIHGDTIEITSAGC